MEGIRETPGGKLNKTLILTERQLETPDSIQIPLNSMPPSGGKPYNETSHMVSKLFTAHAENVWKRGQSPPLLDVQIPGGSVR